MLNYREIIVQAEANKTAIGHFNISNLEGLWAIVNVARELKVPVIIGVSEGERNFMGIKQVRALVSSVRDELNLPIFLNADHTYSFEAVKEVVDAGFDSVIFDGSDLSFEENVKITKQCVDYAKAKNPNILVEGELGFIGKSSKLLDEIPVGIDLSPAGLTTPELASDYIKQTGVDFLAPAVGNIHGMVKNAPNPRLDIERIIKLKALGTPLVLHGGSGITASDFIEAIKAGISIVHINTELRVAYRNGLRKSLMDDQDEIAPYKIAKLAIEEMSNVVREKLMLFAGR